MNNRSFGLAGAFRDAVETLVNNPTDTKSDSRRSETGFTHPLRGSSADYTHAVLTERYWI